MSNRRRIPANGGAFWFSPIAVFGDNQDGVGFESEDGRVFIFSRETLRDLVVLADEARGFPPTHFFNVGKEWFSKWQGAYDDGNGTTQSSNATPPSRPQRG
jgi:hypothetical protein